MGPIFLIGDMVIFDNKFYQISSVYALNWFLHGDPYVYGLVLMSKSPAEPPNSREVLVREGLLNKVTERDLAIWRVLYGQE